MSEWEAVIGLEIHAQLLTESKIFCGCSTRFGGEPNTHTCPVCLGLPGSLPVLNKKVVDYTLRMALATHCAIALYSLSARKNYFYPDLPKGYQISQFELPLAEKGWIDIEGNGQAKRIGITRIHIEEDAGKLIHDEARPVSYVDFNRTGVPLMEIVSEPDLRTPEEAGEYLRRLREILRYLDICDGNMEEGSFRCDANISLRPKGSTGLGTKTELKNMNSFKHVEKALEFEIRRQRAVLEDRGEVIQETRLWDAARGVTLSMRGKEEAHDYRYFPDPDLIPLEINQEWIASVRESLPELPEIRRQRFISQYELPEYDAQLLTSSKALANYFEECVRIHPQPKTVSNWIMVELIRELKRAEKEIEQCPVSAQDLAALLDLIREGAISGKMAKAVFEEMFETGKPPKTIVRDRGLVQMTDAAQIQVVIEEVLKNNPDKIAGYQEGKTKLFGYFVGEVMKKTQGKANPKIVNEILRQKLDPSG
ncbi:MAG: aspartyl/glutamyl-tRNA amidotransferase subunit B [Deltaproteobacteria bacterium RBG_13_43_22]|nr:MAG: aspartyl/glutamyl-tRNA amidotransferase subunit B [Deltaproteobacteria bacterium RBG_13_43_22]